MNIFSWFIRDIEKTAIKTAEDYLRSDEFEKIVIATIMRMPDDQELTKVGFLNKMAGHIFEAAGTEMTWDQAKEMAWNTWCDFTKDNKVKFGDDGWDWDGHAARTVAYEYQINYW